METQQKSNSISDQKSSEKSNIYQTIPAIIADMEVVKKKFNESQAAGTVKYAYRRIDDFMNALNPMLGKHKAFLVPKVIKNDRYERQTNAGGTMTSVVIEMQYTVYAEDGSFVTASTIGEGFDSGDKASNKAMAVALKYMVMQLFMVPTEDIADPDDTDPNPPVEQKQGASAPKREPSAAPAPKTLVNHAPGAAGIAQNRAVMNAKPSTLATAKVLSDAQLKRLYAKQANAGMAMMDLAKHVRETYNLEDFSLMNRVQYDEVCKYLDVLADFGPPPNPNNEEIPF